MLASAVASDSGSIAHGQLSRLYGFRQAPPTVLQRLGRTEPDVHLIKQVEQATTWLWKGPAWRFAGNPSVRIRDAVEILAFLIWQLLHWLLFGCKNSQDSPRANCLRSAGPAMLPAAPTISTNGPHGLPSTFTGKVAADLLQKQPGPLCCAIYSCGWWQAGTHCLAEYAWPLFDALAASVVSQSRHHR
jgi:hypothetical protein